MQKREIRTIGERVVVADSVERSREYTEAIVTMQSQKEIPGIPWRENRTHKVPMRPPNEPRPIQLPSQ